MEAASVLHRRSSSLLGSETPLADSNLSTSELDRLAQLCYYDFRLSGKPCICTPEDQDF